MARLVFRMTPMNSIYARTLKNFAAPETASVAPFVTRESVISSSCIKASTSRISSRRRKAAKARGVKISCDLNYRGKLWTRAEAREAMTKLCEYVDVCISNEEDAKDVFGIEAENTDIYGGKLNHEGYKSVAKQLADKFGFEKVAITLRSSISASDNDWAGMLYDGENYCFSKSYHLHIVDRVGGGDSFGAGLIYAILSGKDTQAAIEFAVAASALKHSIEGDYNRVSVSEVEKLAGGDGSGRVQR
jgi:2-dehydro-3-deoxygluconokinase